MSEPRFTVVGASVEKHVETATFIVDLRDRVTGEARKNGVQLRNTSEDTIRVAATLLATWAEEIDHRALHGTGLGDCSEEQCPGAAVIGAYDAPVREALQAAWAREAAAG